MWYGTEFRTIPYTKASYHTIFYSMPCLIANMYRSNYCTIGDKKSQFNSEMIIWKLEKIAQNGNCTVQ